MLLEYDAPQRDLTGKEKRFLNRVDKRQKSGKELSSKQQDKLDSLLGRETRSVTDSELVSMSEQDVSDLINSGLGNTQDKRRYITSWIDKHFKGKVPESESDALILSIVENGLDDNQTVEYVDNYLKNVSAPIDNDYIQLANQLITQYKFNVNDNKLYSDSLYNESVADNNYKIKALAFVSDGRNIRKWGLYKEDGTPISSEDIIGKSRKEVEDLLDSAQSKDGSGDDVTFYSLAMDAGYNRNNVKKFLTDLIDKSTSISNDEKQKYKDKVEAVSKNPSQWSKLLYTETEEDKAAKNLIDYLQDKNEVTARPNQQIKPTGKLTVKSYLEENGLSHLDLFKKFSPRLNEVFTRSTLAKRRDLFSSILESKKWLPELLKYPISDNTEDAVLRAIANFIESVNALVVRHNRRRKAESDLEHNPETKRLLRDVTDALRSLDMPKDLISDYFKEVYRPGLTDEDIVSEILRLHGSSL